MAVIDSVMQVVHVLFAGLWTGSVLFVIGAVLPASTAGTISADAMATISSRLSWLTRISAVVFVATGGHLAGTGYTVESLFSTGRGQLVVAMLVLWFVLTGLVEMGSKRLRDASTVADVEAAIESARPIWLAAGAIAVFLLVDAGLLAAGVTW
ncbi:MAG: transporter [Halohasta sp.]